MVPQILIDVVVLLVLLIVRIGIPLALILALGYWLRRKLRPPDGALTEEPRRIQLPARYTRITNEINNLPAWLPTIALLMVVGVGAMIYRVWVGLGDATNLNQAYPWGLWIGFDLFMVAFSGGAFTLAALV